jgi:DNA-binding MurR/RpiR family transcriptional regulator
MCHYITEMEQWRSRNAGRYGDRMDVESRLVARSASLTPSERRIGETVLASPQLVAFGTVADVAEAARVGTATIVRFAVKLGFDGYTELQASVQHDLAGQLRPAVERIRDQAAADDAGIGRHGGVEVGNVRATLDAVDADVLRSVVSRLADDTRPVLVLSGVASRGVAVQFVGDLEQLRPAVRLLDGNGIDIIRTLALAGADATLVVLDLRRYERWLLDATNLAQDRGVWIAAISDSVLSPLSALAQASFVVSAASTGPFDSHVGTLALLNLLVVDVAVARRDDATVRLDLLEAAWRDADALTDDGQ